MNKPRVIPKQNPSAATFAYEWKCTEEELKAFYNYATFMGEVIVIGGYLKGLLKRYDFYFPLTTEEKKILDKFLELYD